MYVILTKQTEISETAMASFTLSFPATVIRHRGRRAPPSNSYCRSTASFNRSSLCFSPFKVNLHGSFSFIRNLRLDRCRATSPQSEPPSDEDPPESSGVMPTLIRFQETLRVFFAVLFWMSLFFWSCIWDGMNSSKPNKGSRFRR